MDNRVLREQLGPALRENVVIRDYLPTGVGGVVDYLFIAETIESLAKAVTTARKLSLSHVVIGQGSNVLFSDIGFPGLVILNRTNKIAFALNKSQVIADSGVLLSRLIMEVATRDLTGLEFLFGLRGSIGGATVNNRQANGVSIGKLVKGLTLLMPDGKVTHYRGSWMDWQPLSSRLMRCRAADGTTVLPIILTVTLQLSQNKKEEILRKIQHFGRFNKQLWPLEEPSIGPIFKDLSSDESAEAFLQGISLKRVKVGQARVFPRQPNFILTREGRLGVGKTADIYELVKQMKQMVKEQYGQNLEEAFEYLGTWDLEPSYLSETDDLIEYE